MDQTSTSTTNMETIEFDPDHGDLMLLLRTSDSSMVKFKVNSSIMCLASPVFRAMLGPKSRFREGMALAEARERRIDTNTSSSKNVIMELTLLDDTPSALITILHILHHQNHLIPEIPHEQHLYDIAFHCDKYDLKQSLKAWSRIWIANWAVLIPGAKSRKRLRIPKNMRNMKALMSADEWLFILYVFGEEVLFERVSREVVLSCVDMGLMRRWKKMDVDEEEGEGEGKEKKKEQEEGIEIHEQDERRDDHEVFLVMPKSGQPLDGNLPQAILDAISKSRQTGISSILNFIHGLMRVYDDPSLAGTPYDDIDIEVYSTNNDDDEDDSSDNSDSTISSEEIDPFFQLCDFQYRKLYSFGFNPYTNCSRSEYPTTTNIPKQNTHSASQSQSQSQSLAKNSIYYFDYLFYDSGLWEEMDPLSPPLPLESWYENTDINITSTPYQFTSSCDGKQYSIEFPRQYCNAIRGLIDLPCRDSHPGNDIWDKEGYCSPVGLRPVVSRLVKVVKGLEYRRFVGGGRRMKD